MQFKSISPFDLQTHRLLRPVMLLDVREPDEFQAGHIPGARSLPLSQLTPASLAGTLGEEKAARSETLYLTCLSGARARKAAEQLAAAGQSNLVLLEGGTRAWESSNLPLRRCGAAARR